MVDGIQKHFGMIALVAVVVKIELQTFKAQEDIDYFSEYKPGGRNGDQAIDQYALVDSSDCTL